MEEYLRSRDNAWLGILLERYLHLIFGVCMKYLKEEEKAKDHTQQICLHVLKNISHYKITYFKPWLYQVAKNHCLMQLRKDKQVHIKPLTEGEARDRYADVPFREPADEEQKLDHLQSAMEQLNDPQRNCLELFFFQKKTYRDIGEITGYSVKQVKSYIQNGKRNLKQILERMAGEAGNS